MEHNKELIKLVEQVKYAESQLGREGWEEALSMASRSGYDYNDTVDNTCDYIRSLERLSEFIDGNLHPHK